MLWASGGTLLDAGIADERSYFPLGGFLNLSGLSADALIGPHFGIARLIYYRKVGSGGEGFLNVPLYLGHVAGGRQCLADARRHVTSTARART